MAEDVLHCHADVLDDLPQEWWSDVTTLVERDRGAATACITKLLVGAALTSELEPRLPQDVCHLRRLEKGR